MVQARHLTGGTEKNHENLSNDSPSPGRDFNPGSPEYEAGVLTAGRRRSLKTCGFEYDLLQVYRISLHEDISRGGSLMLLPLLQTALHTSIGLCTDTATVFQLFRILHSVVAALLHPKISHAWLSPVFRNSAFVESTVAPS
jgi:hypothetical protein